MVSLKDNTILNKYFLINYTYSKIRRSQKEETHETNHINGNFSFSS